MKLIVSYNLINENWYVGAFYQMILNELKKNKQVQVEYINILDLAEKYGFNRNGYANDMPSIFNTYNLIIQNEENNKTFVHSWNDYAPVILNEHSGIKIFDITKFAFISKLTKDFYDKNKIEYNIQPSFYILEEISDLKYIEKYRLLVKNNEKLFFNGACYGYREILYKTLINSNFFIFKNKHENGNYKNKEDYYKELSNYRYGLSLNGAANICYRDLEYLGMGSVLFREKLDIVMNNQLVPNIHYIDLIDDETYEIINENTLEGLNFLENKVKKIFQDFDLEKIAQNGREWYEENVFIDNQIKTFMGFFEDFKIFE